MSRIISGKARLEVQRLDLPIIVVEAIETLRSAASRKSVRLEMVIDPLDAPFSGDPNRLQQVFWNLLSNGDSEIRIATRLIGRIELTGRRIPARTESAAEKDRNGRRWVAGGSLVDRKIDAAAVFETRSPVKRLAFFPRILRIRFFLVRHTFRYCESGVNSGCIGQRFLPGIP
jgi:hypothetical protein